MFIIVGLGNPGTEYEKNRHNIGFMAIDAIYNLYHFSSWKKKFQALITKGVIENQNILLVKPQTYMNLSGISIYETTRFYKVESDQLLIIHDELDLAQGKIRLKKGRSPSTHNGIRSINTYCREHVRIRLGIGHPGHKSLVQQYVLGNFPEKDNKWLKKLLNALSKNIILILNGDHDSFIKKIEKDMYSTGKTHSLNQAHTI
ncbi:MAG: PTH1 family [Candidatus Tokpelaia sp. JSC161]|jgi:PTH1 family peptidyl-tRNA hydrolase|nr:MAG: PTH1 family [Candidatus Tokpelaia sp. JSC161]